jgi:hypothetical protein
MGIEGKVRIGVGIMRCIEGIRFRWKESGFDGRNHVSLEGIRFRWKESGFVVCVQIWHNDSTIRNELVVAYINLGRFECIMEQVSQGDDSRKCCI